jgi:hypothetical protein
MISTLDGSLNGCYFCVITFKPMILKILVMIISIILLFLPFSHTIQNPSDSYEIPVMNSKCFDHLLVLGLKPLVISGISCISL